MVDEPTQNSWHLARAATGPTGFFCVRIELRVETRGSTDSIGAVALLCSCAARGACLGKGRFGFSLGARSMPDLMEEQNRDRSDAGPGQYDAACNGLNGNRQHTWRVELMETFSMEGYAQWIPRKDLYRQLYHWRLTILTTCQFQLLCLE
ncbi:hypothetical protein N7510_000718 [Penicillium lagena]|uniref:uncharacterized protein n=1 Tax=Penicillium lagena TaxID=94218 RepID=UPI0025413666|nr:uncharacterized protein N7510_000718 [Penicillium lagena]KAJ5624409.1 hypothetical protein N7510_000718 [Penicillium lagena]